MKFSIYLNRCVFVIFQFCQNGLKDQKGSANWTTTKPGPANEMISTTRPIPTNGSLVLFIPTNGPIVSAKDIQCQFHYENVDGTVPSASGEAFRKFSRLL